MTWKKEGVAILTAVAMILIAYSVNLVFGLTETEKSQIQIGIVYVGDESNPYTQNFILAQHAVEEKFGDKVKFEVRNNVPEGSDRPVFEELTQMGCDLIFGTSYGYKYSMKPLAIANPTIQYCLATADNTIEEPVENYHSFFGYAHECRYVSGVVAGRKLQEMIEEGEIRPEEALVGYVAAFPYAEVISGYTSFLLGVRRECPSATMLVKYVDSWSSYKRERTTAKELLELGCIVISQHSDTIGPAVACENFHGKHPVYHVGFSRNMIDAAPTTSLTSCRINWKPYMVTAVEAVLQNKKIEDMVSCKVINGNDAGAGFAHDWVEMLEINKTCATADTQQLVEKVIDELMRGKLEVFQGNYTGTNPFDENDRIDLNVVFHECETQSYPSFQYVLDDIVTIVE